MRGKKPRVLTFEKLEPESLGFLSLEIDLVINNKGFKIPNLSSYCLLIRHCFPLVPVDQLSQSLSSGMNSLLADMVWIIDCCVFSRCDYGEVFFPAH